MRTKLLLTTVLICLYQPLFSQSETKQTTKSIYVLYGHHLPTNYSVDSGQNNLVGSKNVFSVEMGLNIDYPLTDKWMIRTGINGHLLFLSETTYGIIGPVPQAMNNLEIHKYAGGIEYIESVTIGIPIKALYKFYSTNKFNFSLSGGPFIAVYFPASDEMAGAQYILNNGTSVRGYWVTRHFKNYKSDKSLGISYPQLEWDFDVQATRSFKKYGAISLGIKMHIGTTRLEHATFVIWPNEANYRSKGNFTLNRSYIGIFGAFTFGRNQSK